MEHLDKNLWEIDEIVIEHLIKDSTRLAGLPPNLKLPEQYEIDHALEHDRNMIQAFKIFAAEKYTTIDPARKVSDSAIAKAIDNATKADFQRADSINRVLNRQDSILNQTINTLTSPYTTQNFDG